MQRDGRWPCSLPPAVISLAHSFHGRHPSCPMLSLSFIWFLFLLGCEENRNSLEDTVTEGSFPSTVGWVLESASWEAAWWKKMTTLFLKCVPTCTVSPSHVTIMTPQSQVSCSTKALEQLDTPGLLGPTTYQLCEAEKITLPLNAIFLCNGRNSCAHLLGCCMKQEDSLIPSLLWQLLRENCVKHCSGLWFAAVNTPFLVLTELTV